MESSTQMFHRRHHQLIGELLHRLDGSFLKRARCYFGGGTQIVLALGEYRESRDIDLLCSDADGYRLLRETVTNTSLGKIARRPLKLAREVRADRDGVRTFVDCGGKHIKLEIVREARIELTGRLNRSLGVPILSRECAAAEKFLANTDRGMDRSTHRRDVIDLAFLAAHSSGRVLSAGYKLAEDSYGSAVQRQLATSLQALDDKAELRRCSEALTVTDKTSLVIGLGRLRKLFG